MTHTTEQLEAMLAAATPGPWQVSGVRHKGDLKIGNQTRLIMVGPDCDYVAGVFFDMQTGRGHTDAKLLAAAPEVTAELIAARRKLDAVQGLVETVEAYKSASKSEMVIPADRGGQWGPKGSAIAKTLERKGEMFAALAAWEVAQ